MKKKYLLLFLPLLLLTSCNKNPEPTNVKIHSTFSTYVDTESISLTYNEFKDRMNVEGSEHIESFVILVWNNCGCASSTVTKANFDQYVSNNKVRCYNINGTDERLYDYYSGTPKDVTESRNLGLKFRGSYPSISFVEEGKVVMTKLYDENIFSDYKKLETYLNEHIVKSHLFLVNKEYMDTETNYYNHIVYFMRGNCGDCQYCGPNFLYPYMKNKTTDKNILVFDIDFIYPKDDSKEAKKAYQDFKDKWELSYDGHATLGYGTGVVPTFHYYDDLGFLTDACIYSNDTVSKQGEKVVISDTYYVPTRANINPFLSSLKDDEKILLGLDVTDDAIYIKDYEMYYLPTNKASKYHNPILKAFLDYYL